MESKVTSRPRGGCIAFLLLAAGLLLLVLVGGVAAFEWQHQDRVFPGVSAAGIPLGGMTLDEAAAAISDALTPYPGPPVVLRYGDRTWSLSSSDLGVSANAAATAAAALGVGRTGVADAAAASLLTLGDDFIADLEAQWAALSRGVDVTPVIKWDEARLTTTLDQIASEVNLAPQEGSFAIEGRQVTGMPGRLGRKMDMNAARTLLFERVRTGQGGDAPLVVSELRPVVLSVDAAVANAQATLNRALEIRGETVDGPQTYAVGPEQLNQWIKLTPVTSQDGAVSLDVALDREQVTAFVAEIAKQLDRPLREGKLDWDTDANQVIVTQASQKGQRVDQQAAIAGIEAALVGEVAPAASVGAGAVSATEHITLPVALLRPRVDTTHVADMGIVELVSEGTSSFKGSPPERVHNIANAVERFGSVVVPPGEEFSFNKSVGDVIAANGFTDALVIAGDRTAVGIGGGVCQVSTTAYRAAFWGGFPIVERHAHGYVVSWYGEPGMDASIFTPNVDFRFRNDTGHHILIKPEISTAKGRLTFRIYGTKPDRTVEMVKPVITNRQPAPPALYQLDKTLPAGTKKQVDWAKEGMDALVKRIIHYGDGTVREENIVSKYRPWQAVYLYGPGASVPGQAASAP
jgi:vancomycin resistance protein YoaR